MPARIVNNRRGSTLILVILVFALLIIFATAALTLAESSHRNSVTDWQNQQAYFTARSAVLAAVDYFKDNPDEDIADYLGTSDESHTADMGDYSVVISELDSTRYEISSTAEFEGKKRTVRAIVSKTAGAAGYPFGQNLVTATAFNEKTSTLGGGAQVHGNVMINDTYAIPNGVYVYGNLYIDGDVAITGGPHVLKENPSDLDGGNIYSTGNITVSNATINVDGNIYCGGNLNCNSTINMNNKSVLYVKGDLYNDNWFGISTPKDIVVWHNGRIKGWLDISTASKAIYFGGTQQNISALSNITIVNNYNPEKNGHVMPDLSYADQMEQLRTLIDKKYDAFLRTLNDDPSDNINVTASGSTINRSGTLRSISGTVADFTIDTSSNDIHLLIPQSSVFSNSRTDLIVRVKGDHSAIFHLGDGVTLDVGNNRHIGVDMNASSISTSAKPKICIVGQYSNNKIYIQNGGQLSANIIMPFGEVSCTGGIMFVGSMIVSSSQIDNGVQLYYKVPKYPKIPGVGEIGVPDGGAGGGGSAGGIDLLGVYTNKNS